MTDKLISKPLSTSSSKKGEEIQSAFTLSEHQQKRTSIGFVPAVIRLDEKIQRLRKKKERIQTQQAVLFIKEAQQIFEEDFSPGIALLILSETWKGASEIQKEQWKKRGHSFQLSSFRQSRPEAPVSETISIES